MQTHNNGNRRKNEKQISPTFNTTCVWGMECRVDSDSLLTNLRTHSGMISLSTCTTVSSTWSGQIAITFLGTFEGCRYAPRVFRIDQNFIYSFVLILQFFLWASCPCPNHCCLALVSLHTANKNKIRISHCHRPIQIPGVLEAKASRQHLHLRPWQWHCYHPAFRSLAQHSLLRSLFRQ